MSVYSGMRTVNSLSCLFSDRRRSVPFWQVSYHCFYCLEYVLRERCPDKKRECN